MNARAYHDVKHIVDFWEEALLYLVFESKRSSKNSLARVQWTEMEAGRYTGAKEEENLKLMAVGKEGWRDSVRIESAGLAEGK